MPENNVPFNADAQVFLDYMMLPAIADKKLSEHLRLGGYTIAPPPPMSSSKLIETVEESFKNLLAQNPTLRIIRNRNDLENMENTCVYLIAGLQSVPNDEVTKQVVLDLFELGVRVMSMGYSFPNQFIGSGNGLTKKGRQYIQWLQEVGMILDLSHLPDRAAQNVLGTIWAMRKRHKHLPVYISHAGVSEVFESSRNFSRETLSDVRWLGGILGIYTLTFGLGPNWARFEELSSVEAFYNHLKRAIALVGYENVCLGSDAPWTEMDVSIWKNAFRDMSRMFGANVKGGPRWPDFPFEFNKVNKGEIIRMGLQERNYPDSAINGIMGNNYLRFMSENLPEQ